MTEQSPPLPTIEIPNGVSVLGILETIGGLISFMLFVIVLATHSILFLTILAVYAAKDFGVATSILKRAFWGWYLILIGAVYDIVPTVYLYSMYLFSIHATSLWPIIESFPPTLLRYLFL